MTTTRSSFLERLQGAGHIGDCIEQIRAVDNQRLDRIGFARDHGLDQLAHRGGPAQERSRAPVGARFARGTGGQLGALGARLGGTAAGAASYRKGRVRIGFDVGRLVEVEAAFPPVGAEQSIDDVDRPHALRVVAVPGRVAARHDGSLRQRIGHDARSGADQLGIEFGNRRRPFRRHLLHVGSQLLEALRPLGDILAVIALFGDQHVDPGHEQRRIGARLDGQPVVGLGRHAGETRIDHDHLGALAPGMGKVLHHGVAGVLADVGADQGDAAHGVPVHGLMAAHGYAGRQQGRLIARARAKGSRGLRRVGRAPRLGKIVCQPKITGGVAENCHGFGSVLLLDGSQLLAATASSASGQVISSNLPSHAPQCAPSAHAGGPGRTGKRRRPAPAHTTARDSWGLPGSRRPCRPDRPRFGRRCRTSTGTCRNSCKSS